MKTQINISNRLDTFEDLGNILIGGIDGLDQEIVLETDGVELN